MGVLFRDKGKMEQDFDVLIKKINSTLRENPNNAGQLKITLEWVEAQLQELKTSMQKIRSLL